jgi:ribosomal protein L19E
MGNGVPITMQGIEGARKPPPAQEQWKTMAKAMRKTMETMKSADVMQP